MIEEQEDLFKKESYGLLDKTIEFAFVNEKSPVIRFVRKGKS